MFPPPSFLHSHAHSLKPTCAGSSAIINVAIAPGKDVTIFNEDGLAANSKGQSLLVGRTSGAEDGKVRRALIWFDLAAAIPAGSTVIDAYMTFNIETAKQGVYVHVHPLLQEWTGEGESCSVSLFPSGDCVKQAATEGETTWTYARYPSSPWRQGGGFSDNKHPVPMFEAAMVGAAR